MNIVRNTVHLRKTCSPSGALYPHSANLQSREGQVQDQSPLRKKKNGVFEISFENNFGMLSIGPKFKWFINQGRILRFSEPSVVLVNHRAWTLMEKRKGLWERPGVKFSPETCEQVWGMMALQCPAQLWCQSYTAFQCFNTGACYLNISYILFITVSHS